MLRLTALAGVLALAAPLAEARTPLKRGSNVVIKRKAGAAKPKAKPVPQGAGKTVKAWPGNPQGIMAFTRFNCAFPFCPTTALDVCVADEHYEIGRPIVLATLIEQTPTAQMGFFAYSDWDPVTRQHFTLAARQNNNMPLNELFTITIAPNGTSAVKGPSAVATFPNTLDQSDIVYFSTVTGGARVYTLFAGGQLLENDPVSGNLTNSYSLISDPAMVATLACANDQVGGVLYVNAIREDPTSGQTTYWLLKFDYATGTTTQVGPLGPTPWVEPIWNYTRNEQAVSSLVVYTPPEVGKGVQLMELRNSDDAPFFFAAWLDPETGNSTEIPLPEDWYLDWELDPQIFPDQWPGSQRRTWTYDNVNQYMWALMYDECGGTSDDCDENAALVYLEWLPGNYTDWYVAVEPIEPELTQLVWINTTVVH